jgi:hypothetical protein
LRTEDAKLAEDAKLDLQSLSDQINYLKINEIDANEG